MKINRIMALALACVMLFVTGCNNKNNAPDKDGDNTPPNSENGGIVNENIKLEDGEVVFRGQVTSIDKREIQMEIVDSEIAFGLYRVLTSDATRYFDENGEHILRSELQVGDVIEVVFSGQVMQSYPPQIAAKRIYLAK